MNCVRVRGGVPLLSSLFCLFMGFGQSAGASPYAVTALVPFGFDVGTSGAISWGSGYPAISTNGQLVGSASGTSTGGNSHAMIWSMSAGGTAPVADLHPAGLGFTSTFGYATSGQQQVGIGRGGPAGSGSHALLWSGTAKSAVDLHPASLRNFTFTSSTAYGVGGLQQVGAVTNNALQSHAVLWNGTAASAMDLSPTFILQGVFSSSVSYGTDGIHQVGYARSGDGQPNHAVLWSGSPDSAVDLQPALGFNDSQALGVSGAQQVGFGTATLTGQPHALVWSGTSASAVDLQPASISGAVGSEALGTNGVEQAGYALFNGGVPRAVVWSGSAASAVNLQALLGSDFDQSTAWSVDAAGNVFGLAYNSKSGTPFYMVEWSPTPEPSSALAVCGLIVAFSARRQRRQRSSDRPT